MPKISVVIPVFNEQETLPVICQEVTKVLETVPGGYEIVVVDDGSRDQTWEIIKELRGRNPAILGLRFSRNFGHQNALLAGLYEAKGDAVITMDCDLQHPPKLIPELLQHWNQGYRIVNTQRLSTYGEASLKRVSSRLFYKVFSWLARSPIRPGMADFRLLDRSVVEELKRFHEPHLFIRGLVQWMGFPTAEVTFTAPAREAGESKYSFRRMIGFGLAGITSFSILPLRISIIIGMVTALLAFMELIYVLIIALVYKIAVPGWASILGVLSFLLGVLFLVLGVIGEYIGRMFEVLQARPRYIVQQRAGSTIPEKDAQSQDEP